MSFEIDLSDKKKLHSGLVYIYQTQIGLQYDICTQTYNV